MGQRILRGYPTQDPIYYEPCEPIEPAMDQSTHHAHTADLQPSRSNQFRRMSQAAKRAQTDSDRRRSSAVEKGHLEEPGASVALAKDGDGEWMYNLDTLADEHKKRAKKK